MATIEELLGASSGGFYSDFSYDYDGFAGLGKGAGAGMIAADAAAFPQLPAMESRVRAAASGLNAAAGKINDIASAVNVAVSGTPLASAYLADMNAISSQIESLRADAGPIQRAEQSWVEAAVDAGTHGNKWFGTVFTSAAVQPPGALDYSNTKISARVRLAILQKQAEALEQLTQAVSGLVAQADKIKQQAIAEGAEAKRSAEQVAFERGLVERARQIEEDKLAKAAEAEARRQEAQLLSEQRKLEAAERMEQARMDAEQRRIDAQLAAEARKQQYEEQRLAAQLQAEQQREAMKLQQEMQASQAATALQYQSMAPAYQPAGQPAYGMPSYNYNYYGGGGGEESFPRYGMPASFGPTVPSSVAPVNYGVPYAVPPATIWEPGGGEMFGLGATITREQQNAAYYATATYDPDAYAQQQAAQQAGLIAAAKLRAAQQAGTSTWGSATQELGHGTVGQSWGGAQVVTEKGRAAGRAAGEDEGFFASLSKAFGAAVPTALQAGDAYAKYRLAAAEARRPVIMQSGDSGLGKVALGVAAGAGLLYLASKALEGGKKTRRR